MGIGPVAAGPTRSRTCTGTSAGAIPTWWTPICRATSTRSRAHVITYADDFVILSRGRAAEALAWTRAVVAKLGLMLNEAKTSVKDAAGRASTSLVTRSARSATGRMATGTWAQARPSGACSGSRRRWAISWGAATKRPGPKCVTG